MVDTTFNKVTLDFNCRHCGTLYKSRIPILLLKILNYFSLQMVNCISKMLGTNFKNKFHFDCVKNHMFLESQNKTFAKVFAFHAMFWTKNLAKVASIIRKHYAHTNIFDGNKQIDKSNSILKF